MLSQQTMLLGAAQCAVPISFLKTGVLSPAQSHLAAGGGPRADAYGWDAQLSRHRRRYHPRHALQHHGEAASGLQGFSLLDHTQRL